MTQRAYLIKECHRAMDHQATKNTTSINNTLTQIKDGT